MIKILFSAAASLGVALSCAGQGGEVVVIYNSRLPESKQVADYYAQRRAVPTNQVLGLDLPTGEAMTREEFIEGLRKPLRKFVEAQNLFIYDAPTNSFPDAIQQGKKFGVVIAARVRYAVLCYGVPVKILRDTKLVEPNAEKLPPELRRNEAAVDTQLACLPDWEDAFPWAGPVSSPYYGVTNTIAFDPTNGLLMVARLDGPSASIARGLVDKAIEAETNGLWGRAYIDSRGLTNGGYVTGDNWMRWAAMAARGKGFEAVLDQEADTFSAGYPMSQIAIYAGWYDQQVSGPFTRPTVEFMPGALAYHLYSFSAQTLRTTNAQSWAALLLQKGAACTMGMVDEPYLHTTPNIGMWIEGMTSHGLSFGQAAYASMPVLSWQTTVIGDPLYRPWAKSPEDRQGDLLARTNGLVEWPVLMAANRRFAAGRTPREVIDFLDTQPVSRRSAVLTEKVGDLFWAMGKAGDALDSYEGALRRGPSPMQRLRLLLVLAERRSARISDEKSLAWYEVILKEFPDHAGLLGIHQAMLAPAKRLGRTNLIETLEKEIKRTSAAGNNPPQP